MSLQFCSGCNKRQPGKYANVTIAWWTQANERVAWRLKLCLACYTERITSLDVVDGAETLTCPFCGIVTADDMDPCYVTSFLPNVGKIQLELPSCGACSAKFRVFATEHGAKLVSQGVGARDQAPTPTPPGLAGWAAAGLYPRE